MPKKKIAEANPQPISAPITHEHKADVDQDGDGLSPYFCTNCSDRIPYSRFWKKASTCSKECAAAIKLVRRRRRDAKYCRLCNKPSTPEQRAAWRSFSRENWQQKRGRKAKPKKTLAETASAGAS